MKLKIIILVSLIAICGATDALKFEEKLQVEGGGYVFARTTTDFAKDEVNGTGEQTYERGLELKEDAVTLTSKYDLTSNLEARTNHYYAEMKSLGGVLHSISVDSASDINSKNEIYQNGYEVWTDYSISSKMANMSEEIATWDEVTNEKTKKIIAETKAYGNFVVKSDLSDDGGVEKLKGFTPDRMMEMLETQDMDLKQISDGSSDIVLIYSELASNVSTSFIGGYIPLGMTTKFFNESEYMSTTGKLVVPLGSRSRI